MIQLELTDVEAESFKTWRKHQSIFEVLLERHIFSVKKGTATLYFNDRGVLTDARVDVPVFQRRKQNLSTLQFDISQSMPL